jgi:hypothetical protein
MSVQLISRSKETSMFKSALRTSAACLSAAVIALAISACLYNADQPCGPAMHFVEAANACACDSGAVAVAGGCKQCATDEVAGATGCGCAAGQTKNSSNVCVRVAGLGDACDTGSAPCTDAVYSYCATKGSDTAGTCTWSCTGNMDCDAAYTCASWEAHPYCRTFSDVGKPCMAAGDCTGDANFCDTFQTHSCIISGCDLVKNDCPRGMTCSDFSNFGLPNLCAGA